MSILMFAVFITHDSQLKFIRNNRQKNLIANELL